MPATKLVTESGVKFLSDLCAARAVECAAPRTGARLLDKLVVTDSHPRAAALRSDFVEVVSIAPVLAGALSA